MIKKTHNQRARSADSGTSATHAEGGGASPTLALFRKQDWWVSPLSLSRTRRLVQRYHYSRGGSNTAVYTHGLFRRDRWFGYHCVGAAWWLPPTKTAAEFFDKKNWKGVLSLSRLVVAPEVPCNAASFLIRHSMRLIDRQRWPVLISYADEWQNHKGTIYLAAGWTKCGKTKPERRYICDGRMVSRKAGPKTRTHQEMLALGCEYVGSYSAIRFVHRNTES